MQLLHEPHETDNGRTGAPHSAKRHSTCTDDDDDEDEDGREPRLVFRAKEENRGGARGRRIRAGMSRSNRTFVCPRGASDFTRFYATERTMDEIPAFTRESRSIQLIRDGVL